VGQGRSPLGAIGPALSALGPGRHLHPGPVTGYVESGLTAFERAGHPVRELRPGDVFFEPAGETGTRFANLPDAESAVFIAFYLLSGDQPLSRLLQ
jgi:quercetin dioxygenase-like cupin family protein